MGNRSCGFVLLGADREPNIPRCSGNCFIVSELAHVILGEVFLWYFLAMLLSLFADFWLGVMAQSWRQLFLIVVLAVVAI